MTQHLPPLPVSVARRRLAMRLSLSLFTCAAALASSSASAEVPVVPGPHWPDPSSPPPYYTPIAPLPALAPIPRKPVRWSSLDPLVYSGIAVTVTGAAAAAAGFAFLGSQTRERVCGLTGCVDAIDHLARIRAAGFLATAGAMFAVGVPTLVVGASGNSPDVGARRNPRAAMFGAWLTGFGAGGAAFGFATAAAAGKTSGRDDVGVAIGVGAVGVAMMAAGIPLWAVGAQPVDREDPSPSPAAPARSEGRMNAGLALTSLGTVTLAGGAMLMANLAGERGDFAGYGVLLIGTPVLVLGTALFSVGLPLWLTGAGPKRLDLAAMLPSVAAGPTSVQLQWRLQ